MHSTRAYLVHKSLVDAMKVKRRQPKSSTDLLVPRLHEQTIDHVQIRQQTNKDFFSLQENDNTIFDTAFRILACINCDYEKRLSYGANT